MATTKTPGITTDVTGQYVIDRKHRGVRIYVRLGALSEHAAIQRLIEEIDRVDGELERRANARPRFIDCAARYLADSRHKRSIADTAWHVRLLIPYIGHLEVRSIHDGTLQDFIRDRLASGVTPTTINRTLEVVRTVLNRAARAYREDTGRAWLEGVPPLITMLAESRRLPYPITWEEQDRLFARLPLRVARMAIFAVNTGLRESNLCGLEWAWEVAVPEVGRSVFVIPPQKFKSKRAHVVILNDVAWSIIQQQRGNNPIWVFPYRGKAVRTINNTAWQRARREANLQPVRVHDLRHTYACRLRAAGVSQEDREVLLGHANHSMAGHYASADIGLLLKQANLIVDRRETRTVLRVAYSGVPELWIKGHAGITQQRTRPTLRLVSH